MTKLQLVKTTDGKKYLTKLYEGDFYNLRVMFHKEFDYINASINPNKDTEYLPSIYIQNDARDNNFEISIQTASYGAMKEDDIQKVIKGYQIALKYVAEIKSILGVK